MTYNANSAISTGSGSNNPFLNKDENTFTSTTTLPADPSTGSGTFSEARFGGTSQDLLNSGDIALDGTSGSSLSGSLNSATSPSTHHTDAGSLAPSESSIAPSNVPVSLQVPFSPTIFPLQKVFRLSGTVVPDFFDPFL